MTDFLYGAGALFGAVILLWLTFGLAVTLATPKHYPAVVPLGVRLRLLCYSCLAVPYIVLASGTFPSAIDIVRIEEEDEK